MKNIFKTLLLAVILAFAFTVNTTGQTVYSFTTTTISSTEVDATAYLTYPSPFKTNYVVYTTIYADTTATTDSTILIHQAQISIDNSKWYDYGAADTLIKYNDVAEKYEDYLYTDTPWKYFRHKFTQQDTATTTLSGYMLLKAK